MTPSEEEEPSFIGCIGLIIQALLMILLMSVVVCSIISVPLFDLRIQRIEDKLGLDRSLTPPWFIWVEDHEREVTKKK